MSNIGYTWLDVEANPVHVLSPPDQLTSAAGELGGRAVSPQLGVHLQEGLQYSLGEVAFPEK